MAKTITIDDVNLLRASLYRAMDGTIQVEVVYQLTSGTQVVQTLARDVTADTNAGQKTALMAIFDQLLGTVKGLEL